jgi:HicA toxin of bacterial toxin-antitoxin,
MARHRRTLEAVFEEPVRPNVSWSDVEALLRHHGATFTEGRGSRVRVALNGVRAVFHRPHPQPETGRGLLKAVRQFLTEAGVVP